MKKKHTVRILIYAAPVLALAGASLQAAPDPQPGRIERRIEVRSGPAGPGHAAPATGPVTFLGLEVVPVDEALAAQLKLPPEHGLVVRFVMPDSPAAAAGLQKHDVLTRLDDQLLIAPRQLSALVRSRKSGDTVQLSYVRAGAVGRASATLTEREASAIAGDTLHWLGDAPPAFPLPAQHHFVFRTEPGAPGGPVEYAPHVMVFRPQARIVYREGDVTLEVIADDKGRQLTARGADGSALFEGPIDTPEQRAAVPADLQKHLEKLDALEPQRFHRALPAPAPMPMPSPVGPLTHDALREGGPGAGAEREKFEFRIATADEAAAL